uniref:Uncharacterized protein n=1 Tax=viral metagenome TaxID=1070528 RepID=A0A6M3LIN7_9ZZZZ
MIVVLLSFSASFVGIGLALTALADKNQSLLFYSYVAFGLAILLFCIAIIAIIILCRHFSKTKGYIRQIGIYLKQGRKLRVELLSIRTITEWTGEMQMKVPRWKENVQRWLDKNLPEYAPEFDVEGFLVDLDTGEGVIGKASRDAQHLEGRMSNLREILREIRRW